MEYDYLVCGDCLEVMKDIPDGSVDMILCDLPYGTTNCKWDTVLPFEPLWKQYNRVIKDNGAIVLFSQQPFASDLIQSNRKMYRYEIIWHKTMAVGFLNAKKMPLRAHENIQVFYKKLPTYNPQKTKADKAKVCTRHNKHNGTELYSNVGCHDYTDDGTRYPLDVVKFSNGNYKSLHPTQKPLSILEYLIKTYTNEGDIVLDNCMGVGSTCVACVNTGRHYIGIEKERKYFDIANTRLHSA